MPEEAVRCKSDSVAADHSDAATGLRNLDVSATQQQLDSQKPGWIYAHGLNSCDSNCKDTVDRSRLLISAWVVVLVVIRAWKS